MTKIKILISLGFLFMGMVSNAQTNKTPSLDVKQEFEELFVKIEEAERTKDTALRLEIVNREIYFSNKIKFKSAVSEIDIEKLTPAQKVYFIHQRLRFFVAIEADYNLAFEKFIELKKLFANEDLFIEEPLLSDAYYLAYWIKLVQHDLANARKYATLSLEHSMKYKNERREITAKLGLIELDQHDGNVRLAINKFRKEEKKWIGSSDSLVLNRLYQLMSNAYVVFEDTDSAFYYGKKGYDFVPKNELNLKAFSVIHVARGYLTQNKVEKSIKFAEEAMSSIDTIKGQKETKDLHNFLSGAYKVSGNYEKAFFHLEKYLKYEKEQLSLQSAASISNLEAALEQEIYSAKLEEKDLIVVARGAEIKAERAETDKQKMQKLYLLLGLGIVVVSGAFIYNRYKVTQRQKLVIEEQKEEVETQKEKIEYQHEQLEEVHQEINDSIKYAEGLQMAILPSKEALKENLKDGFVLFKPKDVVSGDFYWMQKVGDAVFYAAADCTGHGVPGAMVSVVCSNALNRSVKEFGLLEPSKILDKTRELVIETFARSGKNIRDGMDIALCKIEGRKMTFCGANNPLWIVRNTEDLLPEQLVERSSLVLEGKSLIEVAANRQPIGFYEQAKSFQQHEVKLLKGDQIYVFTDGYADQFGGEKGKKLKYKPFKRLLIEMNNQEMEVQREMLETSFNAWKGDFEQVDDVCVIGVKI